MLHYALKDLPFASLAIQKHYVSLYLEPQVVDQYRSELDQLDLGRSCLRYRRKHKLDETLLRTILYSMVYFLRD